MIRYMLFLAALMVMAMGTAAVYAHSPICSCMDNGDGTVTCEGAFSDGSSASGVRIFVRESHGYPP